MDSLDYFSKVTSEAIKENVVQLFTILIGAGTLIAFVLWRKIKGRSDNRQHIPLLKRSTSLALIHGGEMALERLVEYHEARVDSKKLELAECELKVWFQKEVPEYRELTRIISKLEMSGKEDIAIKILEEELHKALHNEKFHEAYELEMLLVEMLIYKGDYEKALTHKCLADQSISDARRPLYKAIIFLASSNIEESKQFWSEFCELRTWFSCQPGVKESMEETGIFKICAGFDEFVKIVGKLKEDIKKAQLRKSTRSATTSKK